MTITARVRSGAIALILLLAIAFAVSAWRIHAIRMGGPMHRASMEIADLNADILPPPEYIIEPYLEATLLLDHPERIDATRARLAELRKAYDDRHAVWEQSALPDHLKRAILADTHTPAMRFWQEAQGSFLDAIAANDMGTARARYAVLTQAYDAHRKAIDALVKATAEEQAAFGDRSSQSLWASIGALTLLALALFGTIGWFAWWLTRRVAQPLAQVAQATTTLSRGQDTAIPYRDRTDELGNIAQAVARFHAAARSRAEMDAAHLAEQENVGEMLGAALAALEKGDLRHRITSPFPGVYEPVRVSFNRAASALSAMLRTTIHGARNIGTGSSEIATASEDLAHRTETTAHTLQETSAAIQLIENRLKSSSQSAEATMARAEQAGAMVHAGRSTAQNAAIAMNSVSERANAIDTVVEGLDKISFQTRVLAMNAAVEAGRAGEAGRGFAVVADLVSALALRAEEEAKRGRDLINETQIDVATAASEVRAVDAALVEIVENFDGVQELLQALREDNRSQASAISDITRSVVEMETATQQNAAMVEQTSAAARSLDREAATLLGNAEAFRVDEEVAGYRSGASEAAFEMAY
ncbi:MULTISPECIES: methyl-accepting chemotaxis protein [Sphingomonas]|uniref:Methyl-accepting chemotaxis protein n=1 Tax=Sphingomonas trueperi TaxID=53317 RepID=A0A7X6BBY7_9SPHN|nr:MULTISPECIES: methyl-accepting chemotaxis protein [Sphingomonas]NJB96690.1 methyl-accepting chemotaxis protein [Sphingomonas trueperi]